MQLAAKKLEFLEMESHAFGLSLGGKSAETGDSFRPSINAT